MKITDTDTMSISEPAKEILSGNLSPTETVKRDLPEASTTPPNEVAETFASVQTFKRKRNSSRPPVEGNAAATTDKAGKGKNKKASRLGSKGKTKVTNQEVVDQITSETTIHVKPRRKTQSAESVADRALSKNTSEGSSRSSSGTSPTLRMLRPSSRSSSVASSVPSDQSVAVAALPSPTVHKPHVPPPAQTPLQPISLFHAHGQRRNNQNNQPQSSQARTQPTQPSAPSVQRVIYLPREPGSTAPHIPLFIDSAAPTLISPNVVAPPAVISPPRATSPANMMKAVPPPVVRHVTSISSSSPITRSHCRYHKISLPREEGGPRVCFLVPGCSLNDRELMAAEEIEDHGDATQADSLRMIKNIQSLDFDSYLIGILRQLVGLDILREQEVFYLPQPGEEIFRKTVSPSKERSGLFRGAESSSYAGSPGYSGSNRSPVSMKAPASVADSTSTSLSAFRRRFDSEKDSVSALSDAEIEPSDGELPDAKRARPSPPEEQGGAGAMGPPLKAQGKRQLEGRRSRQANATYQPEEEYEDNPADVQSRTGRKSLKLSAKRRRSSKTATKDDGEERISKKAKMHTTSQTEDK